MTGETKKKERKSSRKRTGKGDKKGELVKNSKGEMVTLREFALEKTLESTNRSLINYKERVTGFISTNQNLQSTCTQQETDALEVIAALQLENEKKSVEIQGLHTKMDESRKMYTREKEDLKTDYERTISELNIMLNEKDAAFKVMQNEFLVIKDFRKKRQELMKELETQKLELLDVEKRHKEVVSRIEKRFFEEKIRLQKDANRKISELANKAHQEAVANLTETTKEVYKENLRIAEALKYHIKEGEDLTEKNVKLEAKNRSLLEEKELHNFIVKEKILQTKQLTNEVQELHKKIEGLEHSLSHVVREFEQEKEIIGNKAKEELNEVRSVITGLKNNLKKKTMEMRHIKRLAQHILDQRTELEKYFIESLEEIKISLKKEASEARKLKMADFSKQMREAMIGNTTFPLIKNVKLDPISKLNEEIFGDNLPSQFGESKSSLDIAELSLKDKERVLRLLFSKMNGLEHAAQTENSQEEDDDEEEASRELTSYSGLEKTEYAADSIFFNAQAAGGEYSVFA